MYRPYQVLLLHAPVNVHFVYSVPGPVGSVSSIMDTTWAVISWSVPKVHLRSPEPSFYCYNFAPTGPIGKIQAPICSSSNAAAIGVQKSLLQFFYLVAVLEMAYF